MSPLPMSSIPSIAGIHSFPVGALRLTVPKPESCSTVDHYRFTETGEDWPVINGYGALIAQLGTGLDVHLNTPAERIHWNKRGVQVDCHLGTHDC